MAHPFASEDVSRPVVILERDGVTTQSVPCHYRCKGLVVIDNTPLMEGDAWAARKENGWQTDDAWGVTHESSGASICLWETRAEAVAALQVLLALAPVDWTKSMEAVKNTVMRSELARQTIAALKEGRLVVVQAPRSFPQTPARA